MKALFISWLQLKSSLSSSPPLISEHWHRPYKQHENTLILALSISLIGLQAGTSDDFHAEWAFIDWPVYIETLILT